MYQSFDDMVEDEYLRKRIRSILQSQVSARGYGNSWNAELGPRNYPNENEGGSNDYTPEQYEQFKKDVTRFKKELKKKCDEELEEYMIKARDNIDTIRVDRGGVAVGGEDLEYLDFIQERPRRRQRAKRSRAKRKLSAWQQFIKDHKGQGYSLKELSKMYKKQRGGVVIQAKAAMKDSGEQRRVAPREPDREPIEGGEYMGGIYLR